MGRILENLLLAKGQILAYLKQFFVPLSLKSTRNNPISPYNGPIKNFFSKS